MAAILVAAALAVALVAGAASRSSGSSDDVLVLGPRVTHDTSRGGDGTRAARRSAPATPVTATSPAAATPAPASSTPVADGAMTISVPQIGLNATVYEGVDGRVLDVGPGHWPGTATPGAEGNVVIAGHRSTSARTFERIGELATGAPIVVADASGSYAYLVEHSDVVAADRLDVLEPTPGPTLTLVAPHPPGSEQYRYVVRARLVSPARPPGV